MVLLAIIALFSLFEAFDWQPQPQKSCSVCPISGKTMLARRFPTILPDLTLDEAFETTKGL